MSYYQSEIDKCWKVANTMAFTMDKKQLVSIHILRMLIVIAHKLTVDDRANSQAKEAKK